MQGFIDSFTKSPNDLKTPEEADKIFQMKDTGKLFNDIEKSIENKLTNDIINSIKQLTGGYAELQFDQVLQDAIEKGNQIAEKITLKINFWISLQYRILLKYLQCFFNSTSKQKLQLTHVSDKIKTDKEMFIEKLSDIIGEDTAKADADVLDEIRDILDGNPANIPTIIKRLQEKHGDFLNIKIVNALFKLRTDMDPNEKKEVLKDCTAILGTASDAKGKNNKRSSILSDLKIEDEEEESELEPESEEDKKEEKKENSDEPEFDMAAFLAQGGINANEQKAEEAPKIALEVKPPTITMNIDGFLMHQKNKRFFSVLGARIYCYKNMKDTVADPTFPVVLLKDVKSVIAGEENKFTLHFSDKNPDIEFQALDQDTKNKWVECINNNLTNSQASPTGKKKKILAQPIQRSSKPGKGGKAKKLPSPTVPFEIQEPTKGKKGKKKKGTKKSKRTSKANVIANAPATESKGFCWCCFKKPEPSSDYTAIN